MLLRHIASHLGTLAEAIAIVIIGVAVVRAAWELCRTVRKATRHPWSNVRLDLGRSLALALEFMLAGDVARTAVAPSWNDIAQLAAIAVIRTGLNVFLHRDINVVQARHETTADA
ncbi:MAG: DUF1622 domain-containing protein [Myxococcota bacterium]